MSSATQLSKDMNGVQNEEHVSSGDNLKQTQSIKSLINNGTASVVKEEVGNDVTNLNCPTNHHVDSSASQTLFPKFPGEKLLFTGQTSEGVIILTNFRLFLTYSSLKEASLPTSLPLGVIETVETRDLFYLYIYTKYVRSYICSFASAEECTIVYKQLIDTCAIHSKFENLFCFKNFLASKSENDHLFYLTQIENTFVRDPKKWFDKEVQRLGLDGPNWAISNVNKDFKFCNSYPMYLIVPKDISDNHLESVANFRYSRRIPTVVWRHKKNNCIIARSSQPEVGWLGWRNNQDEHLLQSFVTACSNGDNKSKKLLVLDARSYAAAVANRAKGGGCECPEYYPSCEVQFMSLANIHSIRKSFHSIRYICESPADQFNWLTLIDNSKWLNNICCLIKSALIVVNAIDKEERPVLVHCSDGWDRTPQIVALAELMLDSYYRTFEGFQVLIEREWISFGHKFSDRCGHGSSTDDPNERCPVFLQWIDCVHQLIKQFPCSFEFNLEYLHKLIHHTYSCLFGTFVGNNMKERHESKIYERSSSVWFYLNASRQQFINYLYSRNDRVLRPSCKAKDIVFWSDVYNPLSSSISGSFLSTSITNPSINFNNTTNNGIEITASHNSKEDSDSKNNDGDACGLTETNETESDMETIASDKHHSNLPKTRSCENINLEDNHLANMNINVIRTRHCSDPNLFRSLCIDDHLNSNGKCADILKYLHDLHQNTVALNRECCDGEISLTHMNRDNEVVSLNDCDFTSSHYSMLSTETLLNSRSTLAQTEENPFEYYNNSNGNGSLLTNLLTTSTSTTELSNSSIQNTEWPLHIDKIYHSVYCQRKKHQQSTQSPIDISSVNCTMNNGNGKHTRTPSSGCPATPNDDQSSEGYQNDGLQSQDIFDCDGTVFHRDKVQLRLGQIMSQHKAEIEALQKELYMARLALCQQLSFCNKDLFEESQNGQQNGQHSAENGYSGFENLTPMSSLDSWVNINHHQSLQNPLTSFSTSKTDSANYLYPNCDRSVKCNSENLEPLDQLPLSC